MNDDQSGELSERSEFSPDRHSSVRRRFPCVAGQGGRGLRRLIQNFGEKILVAVRGRDPGVSPEFSYPDLKAIEFDLLFAGAGSNNAAFKSIEFDGFRNRPVLTALF